MCGIAGILSRTGAPAAAALERMLDAQRHRGPDGRGAVLDGPLALGGLRLAVRDLGPGSAQPLRTEDGRFALAYNGEVYNDAELRSRLELHGDRFRTPGDAEVVLRALAAWGTSALERFEGVFALAFWDARERRLLLARDRWGVRPLYWTQSGGDLLFASEIKGILASGRLTARVDGAALAELFRFQNIWSPRTLFAGVLPVPPGGAAVWEDGRLRLVPGPAPRFEEGPEAPASELLDRLGRAVARQTAGEVPVGVALSGGLDCAAVASEAVRCRPGIRSFAVGFEAQEGAPDAERAHDERPAAAALAKALGTSHRDACVTPEGALGDLSLLIRHLEEPRLAASFQNLAAARLAAGGVKVLLSGGGGDELFGGYPWRYRPLLGARDFAAAFGAVWSRVLAPGEEAGFWTPEGLRLASEGDPEAALRERLAAAGEAPPLEKALSLEAGTFLPAYCLLEDKLHMAFGVEVRVPLLDPLLASWAMRLPARQRLAQDGGTGKLLLRQALRGRVPEAALRAPKQGFVPPLLTWARSEPWRGFLEDVLVNDRGWVRPAAARADLEALGRGDARPLQRVWTALAFELWCREFLP